MVNSAKPKFTGSKAIPLEVLYMIFKDANKILGQQTESQYPLGDLRTIDSCLSDNPLNIHKRSGREESHLSALKRRNIDRFGRYWVKALPSELSDFIQKVFQAIKSKQNTEKFISSLEDVELCKTGLEI